jgi:hypothetical protein
MQKNKSWLPMAKWIILFKGAQQLPFLFGACDAKDESDTWPFPFTFYTLCVSIAIIYSLLLKYNRNIAIIK